MKNMQKTKTSYGKTSFNKLNSIKVEKNIRKGRSPSPQQQQKLISSKKLIKEKENTIQNKIKKKKFTPKSKRFTY